MESDHNPRGVGQSVTKCVVKALCDVKVTGSKPVGTKNPAMLRLVWLRPSAIPG
jgi:hypothetical protein